MSAGGKRIGRRSGSFVESERRQGKEYEVRPANPRPSGRGGHVRSGQCRLVDVSDYDAYDDPPNEIACRELEREFPADVKGHIVDQA
jgi:hypothetical protein